MLFTKANPERAIEFNALNNLLSLPFSSAMYIYNLYEKKHITLNQILNAAFEANKATYREIEKGIIEVRNRDTKILFAVEESTATVGAISTDPEVTNPGDRTSRSSFHPIATLDLSGGFVKERALFKNGKRHHKDKTTRLSTRTGYTETIVREFFDGHSPDILISNITCFDEDDMLRYVDLSEDRHKTIITEQINPNLAVRKMRVKTRYGDSETTSYIDGEGRVTDIAGDRFSTTFHFDMKDKFDFITSSIHISGIGTPFRSTDRKSKAFYTLDEHGRVTEINVTHDSSISPGDMTFKFEQPAWAV